MIFTSYNANYYIRSLVSLLPTLSELINTMLTLVPVCSSCGVLSAASPSPSLTSSFRKPRVFRSNKLTRCWRRAPRAHPADGYHTQPSRKIWVSPTREWTWRTAPLLVLRRLRRSATSRMRSLLFKRSRWPNTFGEVHRSLM